MFDSVLPAESEPISVVSSRWLCAARCLALICTIALGVGFVAETAAEDLVMILMNSRIAATVVAGTVTLGEGSDASAAAGPIARKNSPAVRVAPPKADVLS